MIIDILVCFLFSALFFGMIGCTDTDNGTSPESIMCQRDLERQAADHAAEMKELRLHANEYMYKRITVLENMTRDKLNDLNKSLYDQNIFGVHRDIELIRKDMNVLKGIDKNIIDLNEWMYDEFD